MKIGCGFREYIDADTIAQHIPGNQDCKSAIIECLMVFNKFVEKYPFHIVEAANPKKELVAKSRRRFLDEPEHEYLASQIGANWPSYRERWATKGRPKNVFATDKGGAQAGKALKNMLLPQQPALHAAFKMIGIDDISTINSYEGMKKLSSKIGDISPQDLQQYMRQNNITILPDEKWKRIYGIEKLKQIRNAVEAGNELQPEDVAIYEKWKDLVTKLQSDPMTKIVGQRRSAHGIEYPEDLPPEEYDVFMQSWGGIPRGEMDIKREAEEPFAKGIGLHPEHAYDLLTKNGIEIINNDEAELMYLNKILTNIAYGQAWMPRTGISDKNVGRRTGRAITASTGREAASTGIHNPKTNPGFTQQVTGKVQPVKYEKRGKILKPVRYGPHERLPVDYRTGDITPMYVAIDRDTATLEPDKKLLALYNKDEDLLNQEVIEPARKAAYKMFKNRQDAEEALGDIVAGMLRYTGYPEWRTSEKLRQSIANTLAKRAISSVYQGSERTGYQSVGDEGDDVLNQAKDKISSAEPINIKQIKKGERQGVASVISDLDTDIDWSNVKPADKEYFQDLTKDFVDAIRSGDVSKGIDAMGQLKDLAQAYPSLQKYINNMIDKASEVIAK